jgi:ubiquinone biosynthesis UbiH/UbiF/VisC/COQ6 family hydroxylase
MSSQDVIVLGAGIVGKTAALTLSRQGLRVIHIAPDLEANSGQKYPQSTESTWDSRIYALSSSSQELLNELQVWDEIPKNRVQPVRDMRVFGDSGNSDDLIHFSAFQGTVPQLAWIVESNQIEQALDLATRFQTGIQRMTDLTTDIQISEDGVTVTTKNGQQYSAKLMIAADGANSKVRQQLDIQTSVDHYNQTAVVANFNCTKPHLQTACQWFLPGGDILALLPLPNQRVSMVWSTTASNAQILKELCDKNPDAFCQTVTSAADGSVMKHLGELSLITSAESFPLRRVWAKNIIGPEHSPKIILVGDAAHAMHPLAGQGLNLGLRDISVLNKTLLERESFRSINDRVLLRRYERSRQGDIQALLSTTHRLQQLFSKDDASVKNLRNLGMKLLNRSSFLKRQLILKALG